MIADREWSELTPYEQAQQATMLMGSAIFRHFYAKREKAALDGMIGGTDPEFREAQRQRLLNLRELKGEIEAVIKQMPSGA